MPKLTEEIIFDIIKSILIKEYKIKKHIDYNTSINCDLGIDGDDAKELLDEIAYLIFQKNYLVEFYNFDFNMYFSVEGLSIKLLLKKIKYKCLTIKDLVKYILEHNIFYENSKYKI